MAFNERRMRPGNADLQIGTYRRASGDFWERLSTESPWPGGPPMRMKVDGCDSVDGGVGVAEVGTALEQLSP